MILIGVDAGASRTRAAVWRDEELLGTAAGPGAAVRPGRVLQSASTIAMAAKSALARLRLIRADVLAVGAAGAGRSADADELRVALRGEHVADRVLVTTDDELALRTLPAGAGIALLAGTGSVALGRRADGTTVRQGGLGWQMGDEGGGYWIGREALAAAGRAADGRAAETALAGQLLKHTASPTFRDLVAWAVGATPPEVAALAPGVLRAAEEGDAPAADIVRRATDALVGLVDRLLVVMTPDTPRVGLGGGLLDGSSPLGRATREALAGRQLEVLPAPLDPLEGARQLALTAAGTGA